MKLQWPAPNRAPGPVDFLGLLGLLGFAVARFIPVAKWLPFWGCPLRQKTGYPCPGCGLTRVAERVAHANLAGAWEANPMGTVVALAFAVMGLWSLGHLLFKVPIPDVSLTEREGRWLRTVLVIAVAINYGSMLVR